MDGTVPPNLRIGYDDEREVQDGPPRTIFRLMKNRGEAYDKSRDEFGGPFLYGEMAAPILIAPSRLPTSKGRAAYSRLSFKGIKVNSWEIISAWRGTWYATRREAEGPRGEYKGYVLGLPNYLPGGRKVPDWVTKRFVRPASYNMLQYADDGLLVGGSNCKFSFKIPDTREEWEADDGKWQMTCVRVVPTTLIQPHDQLLLHYGAEYWFDHLSSGPFTQALLEEVVGAYPELESRLASRVAHDGILRVLANSNCGGNEDCEIDSLSVYPPGQVVSSDCPTRFLSIGSEPVEWKAKKLRLLETRAVLSGVDLTPTGPIVTESLGGKGVGVCIGGSDMELHTEDCIYTLYLRIGDHMSGYSIPAHPMGRSMLRFSGEVVVVNIVSNFFVVRNDSDGLLVAVLGKQDFCDVYVLEVTPPWLQRERMNSARALLTMNNFLIKTHAQQIPGFCALWAATAGERAVAKMGSGPLSEVNMGLRCEVMSRRGESGSLSSYIRNGPRGHNPLLEEWMGGDGGSFYSNFDDPAHYTPEALQVRRDARKVSTRDGLFIRQCGEEFGVCMGTCYQESIGDSTQIGSSQAHARNQDLLSEFLHLQKEDGEVFFSRDSVRKNRLNKKEWLIDWAGISAASDNVVLSLVSAFGMWLAWEKIDAGKVFGSIRFCCKMYTASIPKCLQTGEKAHEGLTAMMKTMSRICHGSQREQSHAREAKGKPEGKPDMPLEVLALHLEVFLSTWDTMGLAPLMIFLASLVLFSKGKRGGDVVHGTGHPGDGQAPSPTRVSRVADWGS